MAAEPDWADDIIPIIATIDQMAHRYHLLPSQVLATASTLDLQVMIVSSKYAKRQEAEAKGFKPPVQEPSQEEMIAMLNRVRLPK